MIDNHCFSTYPILQLLYLSDNNLSFLKPFAFKGIVSLLILDISNNYLIMLQSIPFEVNILNINNTKLHTININPLLSSVSKILTSDHLVCCFLAELRVDCLGVHLVSSKCQLVKRTMAIKLLIITSTLLMVTVILFLNFVEGQISGRWVRKLDKYVVSDILLSIISVTDLVKTATIFCIIIVTLQNILNYNSGFERIKKHFSCKFLGFVSAFSYTNFLLLVNVWSLYRLIAVKYPLNKYLKDVGTFKLIIILCFLFCVSMSIMCSIGYHIVEDRHKMPSELCMYFGESSVSTTLRLVTLFQSTVQIGTFLSTAMFYFFLFKEIKKSKFVTFKISTTGKVKYQAVLVCAINALCLIPSSAIYITSVLVRHFPLHVLLWTPILVHLLASLMNPVAHLSILLMRNKLKGLVIKIYNS